MAFMIQRKSGPTREQESPTDLSARIASRSALRQLRAAATDRVARIHRLPVTALPGSWRARIARASDAPAAGANRAHVIATRPGESERKRRCDPSEFDETRSPWGN